MSKFVIDLAKPKRDPKIVPVEGKSNEFYVIVDEEYDRESKRIIHLDKVNYWICVAHHLKDVILKTDRGFDEETIKQAVDEAADAFYNKIHGTAPSRYIYDILVSVDPKELYEKLEYNSLAELAFGKSNTDKESSKEE